VARDGFDVFLASIFGIAALAVFGPLMVVRALVSGMRDLRGGPPSA
jgi:hypothetical protein